MKNVSFILQEKYTDFLASPICGGNWGRKYSYFLSILGPWLLFLDNVPADSLYLENESQGASIHVSHPQASWNSFLQLSSGSATSALAVTLSSFSRIQYLTKALLTQSRWPGSIFQGH